MEASCYLLFAVASKNERARDRLFSVFFFFFFNLSFLYMTASDHVIARGVARDAIFRIRQVHLPETQTGEK